MILHKSLCFATLSIPSCSSRPHELFGECPSSVLCSWKSSHWQGPLLSSRSLPFSQDLLNPTSSTRFFLIIPARSVPLSPLRPPLALSSTAQVWNSYFTLEYKLFPHVSTALLFQLHYKHHKNSRSCILKSFPQCLGAQEMFVDWLANVLITMKTSSFISHSKNEARTLRGQSYQIPSSCKAVHSHSSFVPARFQSDMITSWGSRLPRPP